jgi:hypothetical protein
VRDQGRALPDLAQAEHGQQDLVLPASPGSRRIDVQ